MKNNYYNNNDNKKVDFLSEIYEKRLSSSNFVISGDYYSYLRFEGTRF